jgi:hypothetical protein
MNVSILYAKMEKYTIAIGAKPNVVVNATEDVLKIEKIILN